MNRLRFFAGLGFLLFSSGRALAGLDLYVPTAGDLTKLTKVPSAKIQELPELFKKVSATDAGAPINALSFRAVIELPGNFVVKDATSKNAIVKVTGGGKKLLLESDALENVIEATLTNGTKQIFVLNRTYKDAKVSYDQCNGKTFPELISTNKQEAKVVIGVSCIEAKGQARAIVVSVPEDAQIISSSFFDVKGKGERWRLYELPDSNSTGIVMGFVAVRFKDVDYNFEVLGTNTDQEENLKLIKKLETENIDLKKRIAMLSSAKKELLKEQQTAVLSLSERLSSSFNVYFSLGAGSLAMNSTEKNNATGTDDQVAKSSTGFVARIEAHSVELWDKYLYKASSLTTLPLSSDEERLEHFEFNNSFGYILMKKKLTLAADLLLSYRSFTHPKSGIAIQVGQVGLGLEGDYALGGDSTIYFALGLQPMGSEALKGHTGLKLGYKKAFMGSRKFEFGAGIDIQKVEVVNTEGKPKDASSTMFTVDVML
jgi:hypothetical protein